MPEIPGPVIFVLGVLAALFAYFLVWRATSGRSLAARSAIRGGALLFIAAPIAGLLMLPAEAPRPVQKYDAQLSMSEEMAAQRNADRLQVEEAARESAEQSAGDAARLEAPPPDGAPATSPLAPSLSLEPSSPSVTAQPQPQAVVPPAASLAVPESSADASKPPPEPTPDIAPPDDAIQPRAAAELPASSSEAARPELAQSDWDVVPVFYGTDREQQADPKRLTYNAERGRRLELGRALVTVPKIHQVPMIERPWAIRVPYFDVTIYEQAEDPKQHFTMKELKQLSEADLLRLVRERLMGSQRFKDHAIVFVHGYNTSFDHAVYRTAQIAYDLKFDGAPFLYSWPSGGAVASYTYDRESAGASEPYMRKFMDLVVKETGAKSISVIAHSMGSQPLMEVLKDMKSAAPEGVTISQIILAAPDVDADNFINLANRIEGFAKGVTLYAAANDRALIVSRNFWRKPRAGDVTAAGPLIVPGIDTVDVTAASTDAFAINHSGYAENNDLLQDIGKLIENGLRPPDLRLPNLKRVPTAKGDYWRYSAP